jgi:hypothetical protein
MRMALAVQRAPARFADLERKRTVVGASDRVTGEPILLEIRTAPDAYWALIDGPLTALNGFSYWAPWRALGVGALASLLGVALESRLLMGLSFGGSVLLGLSEVGSRRNYLTSKRLVRQSGLFGGRRRELLLASIQHVSVSYPKDDQRFAAGSVEVVGGSGAMTFVCIPKPVAVAEAIVRARDAAKMEGCQG